jgi:hypothetical protein
LIFECSFCNGAGRLRPGVVYHIRP